MPTPCIFCDNNSGSREHFWPKWIHERYAFGPIKMERKGKAVVVIPNPELKVKTVCGICNNGWMSDLEAENIPIIGEMVDGKSIEMNEEQQKLVAAWSMKTAMMSDSMKGRNAPNRFYTRDECRDMRVSRTIQRLTLMWIGRTDGMHLWNMGTDFTINDDEGKRLATVIASTIVAGYFVIQIVAVHMNQEDKVLAAVPCKFGGWADKLVQIWPPQQSIIHWPPPKTFTNGGTDGIAYLADRWRIGEEINMIVSGRST
jgi:hypothetical protein